MVNVGMWFKAVQGMPRMDKAEWNALDIISKWLVATRSAVFLLTFLSAGVAGLLAARDGKFVLAPFLATTFGLVMAHATNNLLNDLTDYWKGVDKGNYFRTQYGAQPLEAGFLTVKQLLVYAAITGGMAIAAGVWLVMLRGTVALELMLAGAFFVLFYTWPLKYIGLGEVAVIAVWGPLMVGGSYYVITGDWSWPVCGLSIPFALGATTVLFGKHIDKFEADKAKKIRTLPVLLGEPLARATVLGMVVVMYLSVVGLVAFQVFAPTLLVVFFAIPATLKGAKVFRQPRPAAPPADYPHGVWPLWFSAHAFVYNHRFGTWFVIGLLGDVLLKKYGIMK